VLQKAVGRPAASAREMVGARTTRRHCLACDEEAEHLFLWNKDNSSVFRCMECNLGSATKGNFDPGVFYVGNYFNGKIREGYADYLGSEPVLRGEFRRIVDFVRQVVPSGTLIEIGAAYGFFLLEAKDHYQVHGVEIADEAAEFARARGLDVRTGGLTRSILEEIGPIDVAVMLDVIEHLEDPKAALELCGEFLRPGGAVILTTPDFDSALARITGKSWRNMTPPQHLWYFTRDSITRMAAAAGLEVAQISHPWKRVPISLIVQLITRYAGLELPRSTLTSLSKTGLPVNLFDAMRIVLRKPRAARSASA
jgi:2-polyprenyl-3-methyl-5-hydroxy-6-metoxy-1,4-benzoquinol methylase